jgi:hypothetical protein
VRELVLDGRDVAERFVQAPVVVPADPLDDRQLKLVAAAQTRSRMSSVLKVSTKLSAIALS